MSSFLAENGRAVYALMASCAFAPCPPQTVAHPVNLREIVPLGSSAQKWTTSSSLEAQSDWLKTQKLIEASASAERLAALQREAEGEGIALPEEAVKNAMAVLVTSPNGTAHLSFSAQGEIVCEWWNGEKRLTLYIDQSSFWFVKSWGADMFSEMEDGPIGSSSEISDLHLWLQTS